MRTSKKWLSALAATLGCVVGTQSLGNELANSSQQVVFRPPLIKQAAAQQPVDPLQQSEKQQQVPTSRWDAQEPLQTPEGYLAPMADCAACPTACGPRMNFIASVEATFLWPQLSRTFLETAFENQLGFVETVNDAALGTAEGGFIAAPRLMLGMQGECWGLVGRYWQANNWANTFIPAFPQAVQSGVILFDSFRAYTVDLEVQRRFCWRNWDSFGFFGVRYASVDNDRELWMQNTFGGDFVEASAFAGQQYNGVGLTFGVFGTRPLFCDDGALRAYFTNRYSILWGNGSAVVQTNAEVAEGGAGFFRSTDGALAISDGDLFIVELGFGLQWETCLQCFPSRLFFRAGVEWQYWDSGAGVRAESLSFAEIPASNLFSGATTSAGDLLFDLVGFTFGLGITY